MGGGRSPWWRREVKGIKPCKDEMVVAGRLMGKQWN